jgi:hypothetical protein
MPVVHLASAHTTGKGCLQKTGGMSVNQRRNCLLLISCPSFNFLSTRARTSGVTSLVAKPVPPLVTIKLIGTGPSVQLLIVFWIARALSGTISVSLTSHWSFPRSPKTFLRIGMHLSVDGSSEAVSDTIKIAAFNFEFVVAMLDVIKVEFERSRADIPPCGCCARTFDYTLSRFHPPLHVLDSPKDIQERIR